MKIIRSLYILPECAKPLPIQVPDSYIIEDIKSARNKIIIKVGYKT